MVRAQRKTTYRSPEGGEVNSSTKTPDARKGSCSGGPTFEDRMAKADDLLRRYRRALNILAK